MKLPIFILDLDYSQLHIKVHVSQIKKFLPLDKKIILAERNTLKSNLNKNMLSKLENSPARRSSIGRMYDAITGGGSYKNGENNRNSIGKDNTSINQNN